ncbi:thiopeptide-type bacteriocin biosynthesis protein [Vibrio sp. S4M6]|uniref:thiopeptide-type bacteriocin biosynthesis protein n=1 Tax=Vibrio sinus TaxID=2946865 RepID=UPI00202A4273|nr:thiopeptide-type bacteriocin biosynthesis protein [Vibrio sinus]MCL9780770.1 thiopeptide-type bacteriocin biosynthesis protein [Vibrio sinus]
MAWYYCKIYHSPGNKALNTDNLIIDYLAPMLQELKSTKQVHHAFFLRYRDTHINEGNSYFDGYHLRWRMYYEEHQSLVSMHSEIEKALACYPLPYVIELAQYHPEYHKYGCGAALALAERNFDASCNWIIPCLESTRGHSGLRIFVAAARLLDIMQRWYWPHAMRQSFLTKYAKYWGTVTGENRPSPPKELISNFLSLLDIKNPISSVMSLINSGADIEYQWHSKLFEWLCYQPAQQAIQSNSPTLGADYVSLKPGYLEKVWQLTHTNNNRLGLTVADEVLMAELLHTFLEANYTNTNKQRGIQ